MLEEVINCHFELHGDVKILMYRHFIVIQKSNLNGIHGSGQHTSTARVSGFPIVCLQRAPVTKLNEAYDGKAPDGRSQRINILTRF